MSRSSGWMALSLLASAAVALTTNGCTGDTGAPGAIALVATVTLPSGDTNCANGGTRIDTGLDDGANGGVAGDGTLQAGEVRSSEYACNPSTPATTLVKTTTLAVGDANCPTGGTRIDSGMDDGAGGGTAGNGILEVGEVTSTSYNCNENVLHIGSFDPPAGAEGTFFIDTSGGNASTVASSSSTGGAGGHIEAYLDHGSAGGHLKLFKTGLVDASFTVPEMPASFDYGDAPLEVAAGTTVHVKPVAGLTATTDVGGGSLAAGDVVVLDVNTANSLHFWDGTAGAIAITGIHVAAGGTLQFDFQAGQIYSTRQFALDDALVNEGTIKVDRDSSGNALGLVCHVGSFHGAAGSMIDATGATAAAGTPGGNGGLVQISADYWTWGALWNLGAIDTSGGTGDRGGNGGRIQLEALDGIVSTGALLARGADAVTLDYATAATSGGSGGSISLEAFGASLYNGGILDSSGGAGSQTGGTAGSIELSAGTNGVGDLNNTAALTARGGDVDASCDDTTCTGGYGNFVTLTAYGNIRSSGNLIAAGGEGSAGTGGASAYLLVWAYNGANASTVDYDNIPGGAISLSGNLDLHGGDGEAAGGDGGYISLYGDPDYIPVGQELQLLGYGGGIDTSGGNGDALGGNGGQTLLYQNNCAENNGACAWPAGSVINYVDVTSRGGAATSGTGGIGGPATWNTYMLSNAVGSYGVEQLINHGRLDASGGAGGSQGGMSGFVWLYGLDGLTNDADITADGGAASSSGGSGGYCNAYSYSSGTSYGIALLADRGTVVSSGALSSSGGDSTASTGTGIGGYAGGVHLEGPAVTNSGAIFTTGGDANVTDGTGGSGADLELTSFQDSTENTATLSASGGTAAPGQEGASGHVVIDGQIIR